AAAVGRVTAPVAAGQPELVAEKVDEQQARLDVARVLGAVDGHRHPDRHGVLSVVARWAARRRARVVSSATRWRLKSSGPRWSAAGWQCSAAICAACSKVPRWAGRPGRES